MPYEYWRLSPEERQKITSYRKVRGYPLHAPPHPYREAGCYLITAANYQHAPVMHTPERRTEFELLLLEAMKDVQAEVIAWVVLLNHYHMLLNIDSLDSISRALKFLHGRISRHWNLEDGLTGERRVWYKFSDRWVRTEKQFLQTLNYVHYNPVKHGLTEDVFQWSWSSLYLYYETPNAPIQEQIREKVPQDFGQGWDD